MTAARAGLFRRIQVISAPLTVIAVMLLRFLCSPEAAAAASTRLIQDGVESDHVSFSAAYSAITDIGAVITIKAQTGQFVENISISNGATLTLAGGYDDTFTFVNGVSPIEGSLSVISGAVIADILVLTSPPPPPANIIYLHHSTGGMVWDGGVPGFIASYNTSHGTSYQITERWYPGSSSYPSGGNYPYDYWNLWVNTSGPVTDPEITSLDVLAAEYDMIIFKHCFPVSSIEADTAASPDIASPTQSIQNYKLQYAALKDKMHQFPLNKFIVWTGAALRQDATSAEEAERARQFFEWVRTTWDEEGDNIFLWDFWSLETEGGLYLKDEYSSGDSHPNDIFAERVAPYIGQRIVDVIEGRGDTGSITGH